MIKEIAIFSFHQGFVQVVPAATRTAEKNLHSASEHPCTAGDLAT
nr:MAG TPA: hypothetical protein [Caudoviricetes sp.]